MWKCMDVYRKCVICDLIVFVNIKILGGLLC